MNLALICLGAIVLDRILGQPQRWHPLAGFGQLLRWAAHYGYGPDLATDTLRRVLGAASLVAVVTPFVVLSWALSTIPHVGAAIGMVFLYLALGVSRILEQTGAVARALQDKDLALARQAARDLVTRDTDELNEDALSTAAVEAILKLSLIHI